MKLSIDEPTENLTIQQYGPAGFQVSNHWHANSLLLFENQLIHWPIVDFNHLDEATFQNLFKRCQNEFQAKILILGTGDTPCFLPESWIALCWEHQIGIEVMDTASACRTYNLLAHEKRRTLAALIK